jgi:hypothetical protein
MIPSASERRSVTLKVDPAFIAAVNFLRRTCSVNDMAMILGCDRKRVLTMLARLARLGTPLVKDRGAPRYRPLGTGQQSEVTTLHNNGQGLDFYAICRVVRDAHPLAIFLFLRNDVGPRAWWVRTCVSCDVPFPTPTPAVRCCAPDCSPAIRERVTA